MKFETDQRSEAHFLFPIELELTTVLSRQDNLRLRVIQGPSLSQLDGQEWLAPDDFGLISGFQFDFRRVAVYFNLRIKGL